MHSFEHTPPEARELLSRTIRDLGLKLEGTALEGLVLQLYRELEAAGLRRFRPPCYLSDEWACPDREPIIGIPFYLADPKLVAIERALNDVEDEREIMMYLRHEAGHAFNYAYRLFETKAWLELFGPFDRAYVDDYTPVPFSRRYVRHIAGWYAQKHPDEDFAESFAVWLTPNSQWRRRYRGWPALAKLEYVDRIAREVADTPPPKSSPIAEFPVEEMAVSVADFYRENRRDERSELADLAPDVELEDIFLPALEAGPDTRPAAEFLKEHRKTVVDKITYWTGVRRSLVRTLVESILRRCRELELRVARDAESRHLVEFVAFCTTLVMNYLQRGKFTEH